MYKKKIIGISSLCSNTSMGYNNTLIFNIKSELKHFSETTRKVEDISNRNAVIMGKNTFISLKRIPLTKRLNCVISNSLYEDKTYPLIDNLEVFNNVEKCLHKLENDPLIESIYVIGGSEIFKYFFDKKYFTNLIITYIHSPSINYGNVFFPKYQTSLYNIYEVKNITDNGVEIKSNSFIKIKYSIFYMQNNTIPYTNKTDIKDKQCLDIKSLLNQNYSIDNIQNNEIISNKEEYQYLNLIKYVLNNGNERNTRNAVVISSFTKIMSFNIENHFPLLTTKKVFIKGVIKELLWFIKGNTNSDLLSKEGVKIWEGNSNREYLDSIGLNKYKKGDCGPIYGFQWRHYNCPYNNCDDDYTNKGVDQLQNIINTIKTDPYSRRIFMTAWNPCQLDEMVLPPCHVSYQFYLNKCTKSGKFKLSCLMNQRSGDLFLGVPFNIASTALLTYIIANLTDTIPDKISIVIGDAHIYKDHIDQIKTQLERTPYPFPKLKINRNLKDLDSINYEDFELENYTYHPPIKATMIA